MTHYINNLHIIQNLLHIRQNVDFPGGVNSKKKKKKKPKVGISQKAKNIIQLKN